MERSKKVEVSASTLLRVQGLWYKDESRNRSTRQQKQKETRNDTSLHTEKDVSSELEIMVAKLVELMIFKNNMHDDIKNHVRTLFLRKVELRRRKGDHQQGVMPLYRRLQSRHFR